MTVGGVGRTLRWTIDACRGGASTNRWSTVGASPDPTSLSRLHQVVIDLVRP
jgi:hypothetical protein